MVGKLPVGKRAGLVDSRKKCKKRPKKFPTWKIGFRAGNFR